MALIGRVIFACHFVPLGIVGEKSVGIGWRVIDFGKTKTVGNAEQLIV